MNNRDYDNITLEHYKRIAANFKDSPLSTMEDQYIRGKEVEFITREITREHDLKKRDLEVLDIGCGNAYVLNELKKTFKTFHFYGVEFTPELFEVAKNRNIPEVLILNRDVRDSDFIDREVDVIITERVIINILNKADQEVAVKNLSQKLRSGGIYIMIESFKESWEELNLARREMNLEQISESYQNIYLNEYFIERIKKFGLEEIEGTMPKNFLSTHFYCSRVFHQAIKPEGAKVKHTKLVDFFNQAFPPAIGNYSPILFRVFKKV